MLIESILIRSNFMFNSNQDLKWNIRIGSISWKLEHNGQRRHWIRSKFGTTTFTFLTRTNLEDNINCCLPMLPRLPMLPTKPAMPTLPTRLSRPSNVLPKGHFSPSKTVQQRFIRDRKKTLETFSLSLFVWNSLFYFISRCFLTKVLFLQ